MSGPPAPTTVVSFEPPARSGFAHHAARWLQVAAVLVIAAGGVAMGRLSAGAPLLPVESMAEGHQLPPSPGGRSPLARVMNVSPEGETLLAEFSSVDEALVALRRYEVAYQHAAAYLAEHDSTTRVDDADAYRARLVALDRAGRAMSEALREAPYDPVINGYYLTTVAQRQATIRQLGDARGHPILTF